MLYRHTFQVVGAFRFPVDMLRYDACYPVSESADAATIVETFDVERDVPRLSEEIHGQLSMVAKAQTHGWVVTVAHVTDVKRWTPNAERWASFGWRVVPGSLETYNCTKGSTERRV